MRLKLLNAAKSQPPRELFTNTATLVKPQTCWMGRSMVTQPYSLVSHCCTAPGCHLESRGKPLLGGPQSLAVRTEMPPRLPTDLCSCGRGFLQGRVPGRLIVWKRLSHQQSGRGEKELSFWVRLWVKSWHQQLLVV